MVVGVLAWFSSIAYVLFGFSMVFLSLSFFHFFLALALFVLLTGVVIAVAALHG